MIYVFGDYALDTQLYELRHIGQPCPIGPQVFNVLIYLIQHRDRVVTKDELIEHLWPVQSVSDATLHQHVTAVRRAVGDSGRMQRVIQTLRGRGYRFIAPIESHSGEVRGRDVPAASEVTTHATQQALEYTEQGLQTSWPMATAPPLSTALVVERQRVSGREQAPKSLRTSRTRRQFVGREREMDTLQALLAYAVQGRGQVVGIMGEPGMGKSRLLYEFAQRLAEKPVTYMEGHCLSDGQGTPYLPILNLLRQRCGITDSDHAEAITAKVYRCLENVGEESPDHVPFLLDFLGISTNRSPLVRHRPEAIKHQIFALLNDLILQPSQSRPLVLAVENLHWIDPTSEEWLALLVESLAATPLLLLTTYRPGYQPLWMDKSYATQIALARLTPADSLTIVQSVAPMKFLTEASVREILAKGAGNPFFLEELTRVLRERDDDPRTLRVPETVQAVLAARMDSLSTAAKRILQIASVIGTHIPVSLLHAIAEVPGAVLDHELKHLQSAEFLYALPRRHEAVYTFQHVLTQDVAYHSLPYERRRKLHTQIVKSIEILSCDRLADQVERLAYHALRGEMWDKALIYFRQAGAKALAHSAYREAATNFEEALRALKHLPKTRETMEQAIDLRLQLRLSLQPLEEHERVRDILYEAKSMAEALADTRRLGQVLARLTNSLWLLGDLKQAYLTGQRALELISLHEDIGMQRRVRVHLGQVYFHLGHYRQAIKVLKQNVNELVEKPDREIIGLMSFEVASRWWLVNSLTEVGRFTESIGRAKEAVRIAKEANRPYDLSSAYTGIAFVYLHKGDINQAITFSRQGFDLCQRFQNKNHISMIANFLSLALAWSGQIDEALECFEHAIGINNLMNRPSVGVAKRLSEVGEIYLLANRIEDASKCAMQALERSRRQESCGYQAYALRLLGDVAMYGKILNFQQIESYYQLALALSRKLGMHPLQARCHHGLGNLYCQTGHPEQAHAELSTAIDIYRNLEMTFWLSKAECAFARVKESGAGGVPHTFKTALPTMTTMPGAPTR